MEVCAYCNVDNIGRNGDGDGNEKADYDGSADEFIYVILSDSLIYNFIIKCILNYVLFLFLTGLYDLLECYWKFLRDWGIILSLTTAYWFNESSHIAQTVLFNINVFLEKLFSIKSAIQ